MGPCSKDKCWRPKAQHVGGHLTLRPGCKVKGLPHSKLGVVVVHLVNVGGCPLGQKVLEGFAIVGDPASGLQAEGKRTAFSRIASRRVLLISLQLIISCTSMCNCQHTLHRCLTRCA